MRFFTLSALFLAGALAALAADVTGTWSLAVETPNGKRESTVDFKQDGEKLKGTMHSQMGDSELTGSVKGSDVAFSITLDFNGQTMKIDYTAKVEGPKMNGNLKFGDQGEAPFTAEKK